MAYLSGMVSSILSTIFIIFTIATIGYLIGGIKVKGISLGTAGVLVVALIYGVFINYVPSFNFYGKPITLYDTETIKPLFNLISNIGTALFVTAVGLIAGPKFFRTFNKSSISYIVIGFVVILVGTLTALIIIWTTGTDPDLIVGLMTGALTSTPGLAAAKEVAKDMDAVVAGYGIAYLYGVLGVVLFVQLMPRILKIDIDKETAKFTAVDSVSVKNTGRKYIQLDDFGFFPFFLAITLGVIIGSIKIPGINFSLGTSGGALVAGLIIAHFGHVGNIDCSVPKGTLNSLRELGLVLFLIGAGVPGGINFVSHVRISYFIYGILLTTIPMIVGYIIARYVFKLSIFNNLGSITGGMTSTPALGTLINVAKTDGVAGAYAATYPIALVTVVIAAKIMAILF